MFGAAIVGALAIRMMLSNLNKQLEEEERTWEAQPEQTKETSDEGPRMQRGFRYLV